MIYIHIHTYVHILHILRLIHDTILALFKQSLKKHVYNLFLNYEYASAVYIVRKVSLTEKTPSTGICVNVTLFNMSRP